MKRKVTGEYFSHVLVGDDMLFKTTATKTSMERNIGGGSIMKGPKDFHVLGLR